MSRRPWLAESDPLESNEGSMSEAIALIKQKRHPLGAFFVSMVAGAGFVLSLLSRYGRASGDATPNGCHRPKVLTRNTAICARVTGAFGQ